MTNIKSELSLDVDGISLLRNKKLPNEGEIHIELKYADFEINNENIKETFLDAQ